MMASLCSLQSIHQGQRLCSLQGLAKTQSAETSVKEVIHDKLQGLSNDEHQNKTNNNDAASTSIFPTEPDEINYVNLQVDVADVIFGDDNNPDDDIWKGLSDDDFNNNINNNYINFNQTYLNDDMDLIHDEFLPTDPITVRDHLLVNTMSIDNNDNDNRPVLPQKDIKTLPYYKTTKVHLNLVIKKDMKDIFKTVISDTVKKIHVLRMISTHVLKLMLIKKRSIDPNFKDFSRLINKQFIINVVDVIAKLSITPVATTVGLQRKRKAPERFGEFISTEKFNYYNTVEKNAEKQEILNFILEFVVPGNENLSIFHGIDIRNLQNVISAMAEDIVKSYHQNIVANYKSYVDKYVNNFYLNGIEYEKEEIDTSKSLSKEQKTTLKNVLYQKFRYLKSDLVEPDRSKHQSVDPFAISFIKSNQSIIFPKTR